MLRSMYSKGILAVCLGVIFIPAFVAWVSPTLVWSGINHFLPKLLGSKMSCRESEWCGFMKLCNTQCITRDQTEEAEHFDVNLLFGRVYIEDWSILKIPAKLKNRTYFPRIPFVVREMVLKHGDGSVVSPIVHQYDLLSMKRKDLGLNGQKWELTGHLHNKQIMIEGTVGDTNELSLEIHDFIVQKKDIEPFFHSSCNSFQSVRLDLDNLKVSNKRFRKKPTSIDVVDLLVDFNGLHDKHDKINCYPEMFQIANARIELNKDFVFSKIFDLDAVINLQEQKNIHIKLDQEQDRFVARDIPTDYFLTFIPSLQEHQVELQKLGGTISAWIQNSFHDNNLLYGQVTFQGLVPELRYKNADIKYTSTIDGTVSINASKLESIEAKSKGASAEFLSGVIPEKYIDVQAGKLDTDFVWKGEKDFSLVSKINSLKLKDGFLGINFSEGIGRIELDHQGIFKLFLDASNRYRDRVHLELTSQGQDTKIRLDSEKFHLKSVESRKYVGFGLRGVLDDFHLTFQSHSGGDLLIQSNLHNVGYLDPKVEGIVVDSAKLRLHNQDLNVEDAQISTGSETKILTDIKLDLPKLKSDKPKLKYIKLSARSSMRDVVSHIKRMSLDIPRAAQDYIYKYRGELSAFLVYQDNKIQSFLFQTDEGVFRDQGLEIGDIRGSVRLSQSDELPNVDQYRFLFEDLHFRYKDNTEFGLQGNVDIDTDLAHFHIRDLKGKLQGELDLQDFTNILSKKYPRFKLSFDQSAMIPVSLSFAPLVHEDDNLFKSVKFILESQIQPLGVLSSKWHSVEYNLPGYVMADGMIDLEDAYFELQNLECILNGLNFIGTADGYLDDFSFVMSTDPLIDLGRLFGRIKGYELFGSLYGKAKGKHINMFDKRTLWNNLELYLATKKDKSIDISDLNMKGLNLQYVSKDGEGYSTIFVRDGRFRNLPFNTLNSSVRLSNNNLFIDGLSLNTADGVFNMSGHMSLLDYHGYFEGQAQELSVGDIARGLANERGFNGQGDFMFGVEGRFMTLLDLKDDSNVTASGSFFLRDGNVSKVMDIEKKLNLANLVFGGPFSLNLNSVLEVLAPQNNGYYKTLDGEILMDNDKVILTVGRYRGKNDLNLNLSGVLNRSENYSRFSIVGSIPKIPVRVNSQGNVDNTFNTLVEFSLPKILTNINILDKRPRVFKFDLEGNPSNSVQMNESATKTFEWLDASLSSDLPIPALPDL